MLSGERRCVMAAYRLQLITAKSYVMRHVNVLRLNREGVCALARARADCALQIVVQLNYCGSSDLRVPIPENNKSRSDWAGLTALQQQLIRAKRRGRRTHTPHMKTSLLFSLVRN